MLNMDSYTRRWLTHREVLHKLVTLDQANLVQFTPWEGGMSYGTLALHIASSTQIFANMVIKGEFTPSQNKDEWSTLEDVQRLVHEYTEATKELLGSITDEQLQAEISFFGKTAQAHVFLSNALDHEIHHKGQLLTYARIAGVKELPFFM